MRARSRPSPSVALYAWYLHAEMLDAIFDDTARSRVARAMRRRAMGGDHLAYTRELEAWLRRSAVVALEVALTTGEQTVGGLVWCELPFDWSDVAAERRAHAGGVRRVRSTFTCVLEMGLRRVRVHGSFDPSRVSCSTANTELSGSRRQFVLGQVAVATDTAVELRPLAIATRLLDEAGGWAQRWPGPDDGQRIAPDMVGQFAHVDFTTADEAGALDAMRSTPEAVVKAVLARTLGEPVVPKDWGARLRVEDRTHTPQPSC